MKVLGSVLDWRKHDDMLPGRRPPAAPGVTPLGDCELVAAGKEWDAIRVPEQVGVRALEILGGRSGAVIEDPRGRVFYWFVPTGTAAEWSVAGTRALGDHCHVSVPPDRKVAGYGPRWRITPGDGRMLTRSAPLRAAIEDAIGQSLQDARPSPAGRRSGACAAVASKPDDMLHGRCSGYLPSDSGRANCACYCHTAAVGT